MSADEIEQGSPEWHALRCGKVTASRLSDILRKGKAGAQSASRARYLGELVAQRLTGVVESGYVSPDMERGTLMEATAREAYQFYFGGMMTAVAFVDHPTLPMTGASPDRLIGDDGLLEIKCPATHTHIATLRGASIEPDYLTQMHWQMACTGRQWCDFVSYDDRLPEEMRLHRRRVARDPVRIAELEAAVVAFLAEVDDAIADLTRIYSHQQAAEEFQWIAPTQSSLAETAVCAAGAI